MRLSEFWIAMNAEFGPPFAQVIFRDVALTQLGGLTAEQAVSRGTDARAVWLAVCDAQEVPLARRHGVGMREPRR